VSTQLPAAAAGQQLCQLRTGEPAGRHDLSRERSPMPQHILTPGPAAGRPDYSQAAL
jgi:hypothetical protein